MAEAERGEREPGRPGAPARRAARISLSLLLLLVGPVLAWHHGLSDSATSDEPHHLLAGYQMVRLGDYAWNLEHPPLAKDLAGLSLRTLPLRPISEGWSRLDYAGNVFEAFLYGNASPSRAILLRARAPFPLLLLALEVVVLLLVRSLGAPSLALPAALLVGLDPNFVAHAAWVHTDVAAALAFCATLGAWLAFLRRPGPARAAGTGLALGLALATKFSAVWLLPMLPLAALPVLAAKRRAAVPGQGGTERSPLPRLALAAGLLGLVALSVLVASYAANLRGMTPAEQSAVRGRHLVLRGASASLVHRVETLARFSPPLAHWTAGVAGVALQGRNGQGINFLEGEKSRTGWPSYFPRTLAWKTPLPLLVLLVAGLVLSIRCRRTRGEPLALVLCAGAYLAASTGSAYNIGVRHLLPLFPLLVSATAAAAAAAALATGTSARTGAGTGGGPSLRGASIAGWGAAALLLAATLRAHPQEISFFSLLAGGSERGRDLLTDSNVDWGQDLWRLRDWAAREAPGERISILYFGGASPRFEMPRALDLGFEPASAPLPAGLYAISEFLLRVGPEFYALSSGDPEAARLAQRLLAAVRDRGEPIATVGSSIRVYRLRPLPPPGTRQIS